MKDLFLDRQAELTALREAYDRPGGSLFVLYGRRRLGKTTLLRRFMRTHPGVFHLADLSEENEARRRLAESMARDLGEPTIAAARHPDWDSLLAAFDRFRSPERKTVLALDEYSYLTQAQPALSSYLQRWWDETWRRQPVMLVLSGSAMSMMYRETLARSSPLYGRRTGQWLLGPLRFRDMMGFFPKAKPDELVRMWSLVGGVPYYAELAMTCRGFRDALSKLVLRRDGALFAEARFLVQDSVRTPSIYWSLLRAMGAGVHRVSELAARIQRPAGQLTPYLNNLRELALVSRETPVTEADPATSKRGIYRIADPFLTLWFGIVSPHASLLELGRYEVVAPLLAEPLKHHAARAFEQVCREYVQDRMEHWSAVDVGRYWDRTQEIDIVAVDSHRRPVFAAECKWTNRRLGLASLRDLHSKIERLWPDRTGKIALGFFSKAGFDPDLTALAEKQSILLATPESLL